MENIRMDLQEQKIRMEQEELRFRNLLNVKIKDMSKDDLDFCIIDEDFYWEFLDYDISKAKLLNMKFKTALKIREDSNFF
jgi:hypothetical protein